MARKKALRKLHALLAREIGDGRAPAPRNAIALPLVDRVPELSALILWNPKSICKTCPAAKLVYEGRMFVLHGTHIIGTSFRQVKRHSSENCSRDFRTAFPLDSDVPKKDASPEELARGRRLRATMMALGFQHVRDFAAEMRQDENNVSKWLSGHRPPDTFVSDLQRKFQVDFNWIHGGMMGSLPGDTREKIIPILKRLEEEAADLTSAKQPSRRKPRRKA